MNHLKKCLRTSATNAFFIISARCLADFSMLALLKMMGFAVGMVIVAPFYHWLPLYLVIMLFHGIPLVTLVMVQLWLKKRFAPQGQLDMQSSTDV